MPYLIAGLLTLALGGSVAVGWWAMQAGCFRRPPDPPDDDETWRA